MATITGWAGTGASANMGGGNVYGANVRIVYDVYRYNNTIQFRSAYGQVQVTGSGSFYGMDLREWVEIPRGSLRINAHSFGTSHSGGDVVSTWAGSWDVGVGVDTTSMELNAGAAYGSDGVSWAGGLWVSVPGVGYTEGTTIMDAGSTTDTQLGVRNDVTTWGANASAGAVRSYRADNAVWTGQTYLAATDNSLVLHTGLTANKKYWFRGWSDNGAGRSNWHSATTGVTLSKSTIVTTDIQAVSAQFTGTAVTGEYAPTTKIQYRVVGAGTWTDSTTGSGATFDITLTGLTPSTDYEYQLLNTTTAGTKTEAVVPFTTLPAAKVVMPNGDVKSAIPRIVHPNGDVEMVKVNLVQP